MSEAAEKSPPGSSAESPPSPAEAASPAVAGASGEASHAQDTSSQPGQTPAFVMPPGMPLAGMPFLPFYPPVAPPSEGADTNAQPQPMMIHPAMLSQMYPYAYPGMISPGLKLKRKQVKNACTNCQKACKKCDDERPCPRCVKYGIADDCVDSVRKERRKGIKRGSYKKKPLPGEEGGEPADAPSQQFIPSYPAQLYSQWAAAAMSAASAATSGKPGEGGAYYPYFIMPTQGEGSSNQEGSGNAVANPYFAQLYYGSAGYPGGFPVSGVSGESSTSTNTKPVPKPVEESEDELNDDLEEEEEDEPPETPKRKPTKKKTRPSD